MKRIKKILKKKGIKQTWLAEKTCKKLQHDQYLCAKLTTIKT